MMLLLLALSAASILVFLLNVEIKHPWAKRENISVQTDDPGKDYYNPSFEIAEPIPSPDMLPSRRLLISNELANLLAETDTRVEETRNGSVEWIYDRATPSALMTTSFYVYLGSKGDTTWGRLHAGYILETPVFANHLIIDVDGTVYAIDIQYNDLSQRDLTYLGKTNEFIDLPIDNYMDILRHIGNGQNVFVCFHGEEQKHHFQLTQTQIDAVARMMRILCIRAELDEDKRARM